VRALFDTNILLDIGLARRPFAETAIACLIAASQMGEPPRIAPHALATFYYIVAQARGREPADSAIRDLIATCEILPFNHELAQRSLRLEFTDFEDAMIAATAEAGGMDCIVTRNEADFKNSPVPALSPQAFLVRVNGGGTA
jgi:predicted nucleic acid-binding protein